MLGRLFKRKIDEEKNGAIKKLAQETSKAISTHRRSNSLLIDALESLVHQENNDKQVKE